MATFEEHIEGLTKIDITSSTVPNQTQLSTFLVDGVIDCVNKMITLKPEELTKFTNTTNSTGSVTKKGKILSVLREHDSTSILRVCSPIHPSLRYEATDIESLHYRSKYNPGYYELDGLIHSVPGAQGDNLNDIVVVQVDYDTGLVYSDNYQTGAIDHFPLEYENLIALYAAAMVCNSKALDINNNMPTAPVAPTSPDFIIEETSIPELPSFNIKVPDFDITNILASIKIEDFEKSDKFTSLLEKQIEIYTKDFEEEDTNYQKDLEIYQSKLESFTKDSDRKTQVESAEYSAELEKYKSELQFVQLDLQEAAAQYKWYTSQYISFMSQYNNALGLKIPKPKQQEKRQSKREEK